MLKSLLLVFGISFGIISFSQEENPIVEIPDSCLFVPNTVTLNCGSVYFEDYRMYVYVMCAINNFNLIVYNRWGEVMFETNDPKAFWETDEVPDGVYVWMITGIMDDQGKAVNVEKKGHVAVLK